MQSDTVAQGVGPLRLMASVLLSADSTTMESEAAQSHPSRSPASAGQGNVDQSDILDLRLDAEAGLAGRFANTADVVTFAEAREKVLRRDR